MRRPQRGQLEFHLLVLVTLGLVAFGLVMVYSASSARGVLAADDPAYYLKRQALYAFVGVVVLALLARVDFRALRRLGGPLLLTSIVLLVAVLAVGTTVNGARRWLPVGSFGFQPSELAKLALAVWLAAFLVRRAAPRTLGELIRPVGLVVALLVGLLLAEPDLGTSIALLVMVAAMLVVAGTPLPTLAGAGAIGFSLLALVIWLEPYRRARFLSFLDPWGDPQGAGFQIVQAMIALGSGGIFGVGLGESVQKVFYLPEASTDMIFAIVGEELGLVGAAALIVALRRLRLRRLQRGPQVQGSLREAPRGRAHRAHLRAGRRQSLRRHGHRAADRHPASIRLLRRLEPDRRARLRRHPP